MNRRGAILFELVVSMAIFVAAAMLTLSIVHRGYDNLERAERRQVAVDLARSKMAELEAGLVTIYDLMNAPIETVGSIDLIDPLASAMAPEDWIVDIDTERTAFAGLTLVTLSVYHADDLDTPAATLRQLVALRDLEYEEYQQDELLRGLPEASS